MSAKVLTLVFDYYSQKRFGAPRIMAVVLADEADDRGGGIFQSVAELARKSEQSDRAVRSQLKAMQESGLLERVRESIGGAKNWCEYRLVLTALVAEITRNHDQGKPCFIFRVTDPTTLNKDQGSEAHHIEGTKELFLDTASTFSVDDHTEDLRLSEWMYRRLLALNPKHREPSWGTWCKDIKRMRERDERTRREIAELFAWANSDPFWQINVLSPDALRRSWERLDLQRMKSTGHLGAPEAKVDRACTGQREGSRCGRPGTVRHGDGPWLCSECGVEAERRRATAGGV